MAEYPPPPASLPFNVAPGTVVPRKLLDPALVSWATGKGYVLNSYASAAWYQGWGPFTFLGEIQGVGLELLCDFGDTDLYLVEVYASGDISYDKQGHFHHGGDRKLVAFVTSPQLLHRASVWSRVDANVSHELGKTLGSLFGGSGNKPKLGDDRFESFYEVAMPTKEEGIGAMTPALKAMMIERQFRGILELRAGGFICAPLGSPPLDPTTLERTITGIGDLYRAAITR